jgi:hypothetical protein
MGDCDQPGGDERLGRRTGRCDGRWQVVVAQIVEAEQTAVKAHAGSTLAKMAYVPSVAIIGGYAYQTAIADSVLPRDFAYVGVMATYTLFDSGKRERSVKD